MLIISYKFKCSWDFPKKEQLSHLLSERILLLTGIEIFEKIGSINFCEKGWIEDNLPENYCLLPGDRLAVLNITEASYIKTYELVLEKDILLFMLAPGAGQSYFDNLILELKNDIKNK